MHQILEHFNWTTTTVCRHWLTGIVSDLISSSQGHKNNSQCLLTNFYESSFCKTQRISMCTLLGNLKLIGISQNFTNLKFSSFVFSLINIKKQNVCLLQVCNLAWSKHSNELVSFQLFPFLFLLFFFFTRTGFQFCSKMMSLLLICILI